MAKVKMEKLQASKMAKEALNYTAQLIETYGSRLVGTPSCHNVAKEISSSLSSYCDSVQEDSFTLHPGAFLGWIKILVLLYPVALLFSFLSLPLISFLLMGTGLYIMITEFFLYKEILDPLYPKKEGVNVYGVLEPSGRIQQTVVFSGHHDSAHIFNFFTQKPQLYMIRVGIGLVSVFLLTSISLIHTIVSLFSRTLWKVSLAEPFFLILSLLLLCTTPWVAKLWFFASKEGSPGAGDNLISSAMGIQLARYFSQARERGSSLKHTRLVFASFDGEEAGLRGSRAFYRDHKEDLLGATCWNFNVDCPYQAKDLFFLTSDINGSVKLSQEMATRCVSIAKGMGYDAFSQPIAFLTGGTDAAEAAKAGCEAVSLMAMPWDNKSRSAVYHTPEDLPESIDIQAVEETLSIAIRFIEQVDNELSENPSSS